MSWKSGLAADLDGPNVPRLVPAALPHPVGGVPLRPDAQPGHRLGELVGCILDGQLKILCIAVPGRVHPLQVGQRLRPDVLAGLGVAAADGMVAGHGRPAVIQQQRIGHPVGQFGQPGVVLAVVLAPAGLQRRRVGPAAAGGAVHLQPAVLPAALVPAVEGIAVAGHHLRLDGRVRPIGRQLTGRRPHKEIPHRHLHRPARRLIPEQHRLPSCGLFRRGRGDRRVRRPGRGRGRRGRGAGGVGGVGGPVPHRVGGKPGQQTEERRAARQHHQRRSREQCPFHSVTSAQAACILRCGGLQ